MKRLPPPFDDYAVTDDGRVFSYKSGTCKQRKTALDWDGYEQTVLYASGSGSHKERRKRFYVHQLVLLAFVGPCPFGMEVRHLDGDRSNNHLTNLRYGTTQENADDRARHGTDPRGVRNPAAKLLPVDVDRIRTLAGKGVPHKYIAEAFDISASHVSNIQAGRAWGDE